MFFLQLRSFLLLLGAHYHLFLHFYSPVLDEFYYYCGTQARLQMLDPFSEDGEVRFDMCSISESTAIVSRITEDGATAEQIDAVDVNETSKSLFNTSDIYAASQYGAIFYTNDPSSQIVETGASYSESVQLQCQSLVQNSTYNTEEECLAFGHTGYLIQVSATYPFLLFSWSAFYRTSSLILSFFSQYFLPPLQYNFTALHVAPTFQALATEGLVRDALNDNEYTVASTIYPLPLTSIEASLIESEDAFTAWFLVCLSFP
jgi:hypothetical protein